MKFHKYLDPHIQKSLPIVDIDQCCQQILDSLVECVDHPANAKALDTCFERINARYGKEITVQFITATKHYIQSGHFNFKNKYSKTSFFWGQVEYIRSSDTLKKMMTDLNRLEKEYQGNDDYISYYTAKSKSAYNVATFCISQFIKQSHTGITAIILLVSKSVLLVNAATTSSELQHLMPESTEDHLLTKPYCDYWDKLSYEYKIFTNCPLQNAKYFVFTEYHEQEYLDISTQLINKLFNQNDYILLEGFDRGTHLPCAQVTQRMSSNPNFDALKRNFDQPLRCFGWDNSLLIQQSRQLAKASEKVFQEFSDLELIVKETTLHKIHKMLSTHSLAIRQQDGQLILKEMEKVRSALFALNQLLQKHQIVLIPLDKIRTGIKNFKVDKVNLTIFNDFMAELNKIIQHFDIDFSNLDHKWIEKYQEIVVKQRNVVLMQTSKDLEAPKMQGKKEKKDKGRVVITIGLGHFFSGPAGKLELPTSRDAQYDIWEFLKERPSVVLLPKKAQHP